MIQFMKWALPLCLILVAIPAGAQTASVAGYTTLDYDAQTNTMIGTCTMDPDYTTQAYYTSYSICTIGVTGTDAYEADGISPSIQGDGGSPNSTAELTPSAGVSYTASGYYGFYYFYIAIVYAETGIMGSAWDPWDFSYFEEYPDEDCSALAGCSWEGDWIPTIYVVADTIAVGSTASNPVTADDPAYAVVVSDNTGQNLSGNEERVTTYQVHNANGSIASGISVGENFSATNWSCTNKPQPATTVTLCSSPWVTDSDGQYSDFWADYGTSYSGPGGSDCGAETVVDHWQWCPLLQTFMTLKGWIHTTSSDINGWVNPPSATKIPTGMAFGP